MDFPDAEGLAVWLYQHHGVDPEVPVSWRRFVPALVRHRGRGRAVSFTDKIAQRARIRPEHAGFVALHEHAHILFREHRVTFATELEEETCADYFAACALAPRAAVRAFARSCGRDPEALAAYVGATEIWAHLRFAEVFGESLAVVGPSMVWARGDFVGVHESTLRECARSPSTEVRVLPVGRARVVSLR